MEGFTLAQALNLICFGADSSYFSENTISTTLGFFHLTDLQVCSMFLNKFKSFGKTYLNISSDENLFPSWSTVFFGLEILPWTFFIPCKIYFWKNVNSYKSNNCGGSISKRKK